MRVSLLILAFASGLSTIAGVSASPPGPGAATSAAVGAHAYPETRKVDADGPVHGKALAHMTALADLYPMEEPPRQVNGRGFHRALVEDRIVLKTRDPGAAAARRP